MDIQPINSNLQKISSLPALPHKRCEFCHSVFVTDIECESCGRQFNKATLGAPGGEKSFYALSDRYRRDVGSFLYRFDYFLAKDAALRVRHLAMLKKRYLTLIDHLQRSSRTQSVNHIYLIEFRDLVSHMHRLKITPDYLYDMVMLDPDSPMTPKLISILNEEFAGSRYLRNLYDLRIFGSFRVSFILLTLAFYGSITFAAIMLFDYFVKR